VANESKSNSIADSLPIAYRVTAIDEYGILQYQQDFQYRPDFDAYKVAHRNAAKIQSLFDECKVEVTPLTIKDMVK
jgi:hypothetical protein